MTSGPRVAVAGFVLLLLCVPLVGGAVAAAPANTTTPTQVPSATATTTPTATPSPTPTPTPAASTGGADGGEFTRNELMRGGTQPENAPPSVRYLGQTGAVAIRYTPAAPLQNQWQYLNRGTTLHTDDIQLYSTRFGTGIGESEYTLHVVFWQTERRQVETANGTKTVLVAANQTETTYTATLGTGYDVSNKTLPSHFDAKWSATMWLSQAGEPIDGARWRFGHRSDPGGRNVDISTETDAWTFTTMNAVIPGGIGLVVGLLMSRGTLRKTGRGPDIGGLLWAFGGFALVMMVASAFYFQAAVILDHAPWVMGALFTVVGYAGGFLFANPVRRIQFERQEIFDAKILPGFDRVDAAPDSGDPLADGGTATVSPFEATDNAGGTDFIAADEYKEELYRDAPEKRVVRTDEGFVVPERGIRPFLARLFADPARLDLSSFRTRILVDEGRIDEVIAVDPESEQPVWHTPAKVVRSLPWDRLPRDDETGEIVVDQQEQAIAGGLSAAIVLGPPALGFYLFDATLGIPGVGVLCGLIATAALAYSATDGEIDFAEAAVHQNPARTTITHMQAQVKDAKDLEDAEEDAWGERAKSKREARESIERERRTVTDRVIGLMTGDEDGAAVERTDPVTNGHDVDEDHPGNFDTDEEGDDGDD